MADDITSLKAQLRAKDVELAAKRIELDQLQVSVCPKCAPQE